MSFANSIPSIIPSSSTLTSPIITTCENINETSPYKQDNQQQQQNNLNQTRSSGTSPTSVGTPKENSSGTGKQPPSKSYCILTPCSNSHPFEERRILVGRSEENAVKIGRSIVRLQPAHSNAIFDCKVLSRNHAILWMNDDVHFFIKDTRSSNGTFINNDRLSPSGEESEPRELFSGDILQLGVEIVDNAKKVASGCVTCIVRLTNERGEEYVDRPQLDSFAFPIRNENQIPLNYTLVRNDKLFIFEQYLKEAKHRENLLGQKLQTIEGQLLTAQEELQAKWDEHINQELLLSRIELLESQLLTYLNAKNAVSPKNAQTASTNCVEKEEEVNQLKREIRELIEDRAKSEQLAKESIRKKCEQIQEATMRLNDVEMGLVNVEEECAFLRQRCSDYDLQLIKQRDNYDMLMGKYNEVCAQLVTAEKAAASAKKSLQPPPSPPPMEKGFLVENGVDVSTCSSTDTKEEKENLTKDKNTEKMDLSEKDNNKQHESNVEEGEIVSPSLEEGEIVSLTKSTFYNEEEQKMANYFHNCKEQELLKKVAELELQLKERKINGNNNNEEERALTTTMTPQSADDFQVFLLSIFPFLLVLMLFLAPFFYFSAWPWTSNNEQNVENEQQLLQNEEELSNKEENE
uniref:FHA domain-containing protein n=1 Tax=Meloidogyne incognita TaxID=6306 RepID=A0A914KUB1_MELIC